MEVRKPILRDHAGKDLNRKLCDSGPSYGTLAPTKALPQKGWSTLSGAEVRINIVRQVQGFEYREGMSRREKETRWQEPPSGWLRRGDPCW